MQIDAILKFQNILLYLDFGYLPNTIPLLAQTRLRDIVFYQSHNEVFDKKYSVKCMPSENWNGVFSKVPSSCQQ